MRDHRSHGRLPFDMTFTASRNAAGRPQLVIASTVMAYPGEEECGA